MSYTAWFLLSEALNYIHTQMHNGTPVEAVTNGCKLQLDVYLDDAFRYNPIIRENATGCMHAVHM